MGAGGSNPLWSTIQSVSFRTSRRIDRNPRVCARFAIGEGPGERLRRALNGGIRQNLSARDFARSMEVRSNIAFIDRTEALSGLGGPGGMLLSFIAIAFDFVMKDLAFSPVYRQAGRHQ